MTKENITCTGAVIISYSFNALIIPFQYIDTYDNKVIVFVQVCNYQTFVTHE